MITMSRENSSYIHHLSLSLCHSYELCFYSQLLAVFLSWSSDFFLENSIDCISSHNKEVNSRFKRRNLFIYLFIFLHITSVYFAHGNNCVSEISQRAQFCQRNCFQLP